MRAPRATGYPRTVPILVLLLACHDEPAPSVAPDGGLDAVARANRVSMQLRGVRPTPSELDHLSQHPEALPALADAWSRDPRFGDTVRDLHADVLWMRADTKPQWLPMGILADRTPQELTGSFQEAPLRFVEHVVTEGRPYTEVVTADYAYTDAIGAVAEGLDFDPDGPPWQETRYVDGRPVAGLLSNTHFLQRWYTNFSGKHRNRANMVSRAFLCSEIGAIDMGVFPSVDPSDNEATANALRDNPACAACHVALDPLAAYFWGFEINIISLDIARAEEGGCEADEARCYPIRYWADQRADNYLDYDLPPPGYYGVPGTDMVDLGASIAADPRFASCAVQNAWAFFAQEDRSTLPLELRERLMDLLVDEGWDYRRMVVELVLSDELTDAERVLQVRPEALGRLIADTTEHQWTRTLDSCGTVDVLGTSLHGLRDLAGGTDHDRVLEANHAPGPTVLLAWDAAAREAAAHAVAEGVVDGSLREAGPVREQVEAWVLRTTGRRDDAQVDALVAVFDDALALADDSEQAWRVTLRAALMDPAVVTY